MDDDEWQAYAWAEYNGEPWQVDEFMNTLIEALLKPIGDVVTKSFDTETHTHECFVIPRTLWHHAQSVDWVD